MLSVTNLACARNDLILFTKLNFTLLPGNGLQLHAANGMGKTTLLKTLAGLLKPLTGTVIFDSTLLYCGHNNNLHSALSPLQNLSFLCALQDQKPRQDIIDALCFVGLQEQIHTPCGELSAGQRQRAVLARMRLSQAKLWLLDEPQINLDRAAQNILLKLCAQHLQNNGMLVVAAHEKMTTCNADLRIAEYA